MGYGVEGTRFQGLGAVLCSACDSVDRKPVSKARNP